MPKSIAPRRTNRDLNTMFWKCSPTRQGASIWAMSAITLWATWWRAISAPRAITCFTRWAGTHSVCRLKMPPLAKGHPSESNGPTEHCRNAWPVQGDGAVATTGAVSWRPAIRILRAAAAPVHRLLQQRTGLSQEEQGQLGPGRAHRAGERAGDRRPRLAVWRAG